MLRGISLLRQIPAHLRIGVEVEIESGMERPPAAANHYLGRQSVWQQIRDGSLRGSYATEWVTRSLDGIPGTPVRTVIDSLGSLIGPISVADGCWRAGVHVHWGVRHIVDTPHGGAALVCAAAAYDQPLFDQFSPERTESNFCVPMSHLIDLLGPTAKSLRLGRIQWPRYSSMNFAAWPRHGTLEFRHMKTPAGGSGVADALGVVDQIAAFIGSTYRAIDLAERTVASLSQTPADAVTVDQLVEELHLHATPGADVGMMETAAQCAFATGPDQSESPEVWASGLDEMIVELADGYDDMLRVELEEEEV